MPGTGDIASLLLTFDRNPAVEHLLRAYITRTGVKCVGIRSHTTGEVTFDVELPPGEPGGKPSPGLYTLTFDATTGQPSKALLEPGA
jgi:hypothetical protein